MSFVSKIKLAWWAINYFGSRSNKTAHWTWAGVSSLVTMAGMVMAMISGSWGIALLSLLWNMMSSNISFASQASVKNLNDEIRDEGVRIKENPERASKLSLSAMSLGVLAHWLLKALQATIAIKLFMAGYSSLTSAVKEGRSATHRASDVGKAIMWFICIPLMFFFEFNTILEALRGPLGYIGLYDSVSRVFNSKSDSERRDKEIKLQEERNLLEREKFEWAKSKDERNDHKLNADTMRSGNDALNSNLEGLLKIESLLKSNDPIVVELAYSELYKRKHPYADPEQIEELVARRMKTSSIYLGKTPNKPRAETPLDLESNSNKDAPRFVKGSDEVVAEKPQLQGIGSMFSSAVTSVTKLPLIPVAIVITFLILGITIIVVSFSRKSARKHQKATEELLEAASGNLIVSDEVNNEWYETYLEDCELLFGSIPDPQPGFDCTTERAYLLTLASTISNNKTDRTRLATLCGNKSADQVKSLISHLAEHRKPKLEAVKEEVKVEEIKISEADVAKHVPQEAVQAIVAALSEASQPQEQTKVEATKVEEPPKVEAAAPVVEAITVVAPQAPVTKPKDYICTCGKGFASTKARYTHRKRVGCAAPEAKTKTVPANTNPEVKAVDKSAEKAAPADLEGKKKQSKGQNMKKKDEKAGKTPKQKKSKQDRVKAKLNKIEDERNRKFNTWRELKDSKAWADQQIAEEIREQLEELKRQHDAYEKGVVEAATAELESFLRTAMSAQELERTKAQCNELKAQLEAVVAQAVNAVEDSAAGSNTNQRSIPVHSAEKRLEGVSVGAKRDIPDIRVKCTVQTVKGVATVLAMPMANKLFVPTHFVLENCKDIDAGVDSTVAVQSSRGLPLPSFKLGLLRVVDGITDQCYIDYQVGGLTYAPVDSIGGCKVGEKIVIRKFEGDTVGDITAINGDEARNVGTSTKPGDCNALVYSTETGKLIGLHRAFYKVAGENAFTLLEKLPKKYLVSKPILDAQPVLSEN